MPRQLINTVESELSEPLDERKTGTSAMACDPKYQQELEHLSSLVLNLQLLLTEEGPNLLIKEIKVLLQDMEESLLVLNNFKDFISSRDQRLFTRVASVKELAEKLVNSTATPPLKLNTIETNDEFSETENECFDSSDTDNDHPSSSSSFLSPVQEETFIHNSHQMTSTDSVDDQAYQRLCDTLQNLIKAGKSAVDSPIFTSHSPSTVPSDSQQDSKPDTYDIVSNSPLTHLSTKRKYQHPSINDIFDESCLSDSDSDTDKNCVVPRQPLLFNSPKLTQSIRGVKGELRRVEHLARIFANDNINDDNNEDLSRNWPPSSTLFSRFGKAHNSSNSFHTPKRVLQISLIQKSPISPHSSEPSITSRILVFNPLLLFIIALYQALIFIFRVSFTKPAPEYSKDVFDRYSYPPMSPRRNSI